MKTASTKTESQSPEDILQMARLRVEIAESRREETKEQAREARRKRKEAKTAARAAKKEARQAKAELAEARSFLAKAEAELAPPIVSVAKARKGRSTSAAVPVAPETPGLDPEDETSTASAPASTIEKLPQATPPGPFGNWR